MTPQEITDCKENVGVLYDDISLVRVRGKGIAQIFFFFVRKQKLGWERISFTLRAEPETYKENLLSSGELLRRFIPSKLDNQLQNTKYGNNRELFENQKR